jgi:PAS domain S-box-containing protein
MIRHKTCSLLIIAALFSGVRRADSHERAKPADLLALYEDREMLPPDWMTYSLLPYAAGSTFGWPSHTYWVHKSISSKMVIISTTIDPSTKPVSSAREEQAVGEGTVAPLLRHGVLTGWPQRHDLSIAYGGPYYESVFFNFMAKVWNRYSWYVLAAIVIVLLLQGILAVRVLIESRRRKAVDRMVRRRAAFEGLLAEITSHLADAPSERTLVKIRRGVDQLRSHLGAEQILLFSRREDTQEFEVLCASAADKFAPPAPAPDAHKFLWSMKPLPRGEAMVVERLEEILFEPAPRKRRLQKSAFKSMLIIPIATHYSKAGFFALSYDKNRRGWPDNLVHQLQTLGNVFHQSQLRQQTQGQAYEMERQFALLADTAPVMIWMTGIDKLCTYCNHGWLAFTGRTLDQELGRGWLGRVHLEDLERFQSSYSAAFDERRQFELECRMLRFDGEYRWLAIYGVPRYQPDGTFCGYIGACTDVTNLKLSERDLKELSIRLIDHQEDERREIARELHDDFSQQLTILGLELARLSLYSKREPTVEALVRDLGVRIKNLAQAMNNRAHQLHSSHLELLGLPSAIQGFCSDFSRQTGIAVDFRQSGILPLVPSNISLCLFRILQEGLENIGKHSHARSCSVELKLERENVLLRISDSGVGFDPARPPKTGFGLINMRERVRLVNGHIRLLSSPHQGTRLEVQVPLRKTAASA